MLQLRRALSRDDGAVAVVAAIVMMFLSLALLSLTIDVGQLMAERRKLQNGADAAAVALAVQYAKAGTVTTTDAANWAGGNDVDDALANASVYGNVAGLTPYGGPWRTADRPYAPDAPAAGVAAGPYVEVLTTTRTAAPSGLLKFFFNPGSGTVSAFARAAITVPTGARALAATISGCEWNYATQRGYGPYSSDPREYALVLQAGSGSNAYVSPCAGDPAYKDAPGAFGWLKENGSVGAVSQCEAKVSDGTAWTDSGANTSSDCGTLLEGTWQYNKGHQTDPEPLYVPIFSAVSGSGSGVTYRLQGFAAFILTGFDLTSTLKESSWLTGKSFKAVSGLGGSPKGMMGYFIHDLIPDASGAGGTPRGTTAVSLVK
jgi:hypothetical protein